MKPFYLIFCFAVVSAFPSLSQNVGIGTSGTPSNKLHVFSSANPLRIEGLQSGSSTDSVLTTDGTGVVRRRTPASFISGAGWALAGNASTNPSTQFIGTTDAQALVFRTNNFRSGFIDFDSSKRNTSFGNRAMATTPTGFGNSALGYQALSKVTSGFSNNAVGDSAGFSITSGSENVMMGSGAGSQMTIATQNVGIGHRALATISAGSGNVAVGYRALENNFAAQNIAIGDSAMNGNTGGSSNIAIGSNALQFNSVGYNNYAIGSSSLFSETTGFENLALGIRALDSITTTAQNTALGHYALSLQTLGSYNTAVGFQAGGNIKNGSNNTFIGFGADVNASTLTPSNSTALGSGALVTQSNMVRVGNTSTTLVGSSVGFTTISDERVKTNILENVPGLEFISLLRPVSYNYNLNAVDDIEGMPQAKRNYDGEKAGIRYSGFLAQEVDAAAKKIGYNSSAVSIPKNAHSLYGINYSELVVPLVKAVQELKALVEKQQEEITILKQKVQQ